MDCQDYRGDLIVMIKQKGFMVLCVLEILGLIAWVRVPAVMLFGSFYGLIFSHYPGVEKGGGTASIAFSGVRGKGPQLHP